MMQCSAREQRLLVDAFAMLARHPGTTGDYTFVDADGRQNHVLDLNGFVATFWTDHAARVVRVLLLERI
jgi:hypothetical protein